MTPEHAPVPPPEAAVYAFGDRTWWRGHKLNYAAPEPLLVSLLKYRPGRDRVRVEGPAEANLVCSRTDRGTQLPIIDLDFPHAYVPSTKPGHGHLYLNVEIPHWRWVVLMVALRIAGVHELGANAWGLRRGANFVRPPWVAKTVEEHLRAEWPPNYGWLRRIKNTPEKRNHGWWKNY